ncbi:MAG TPA: DUF2767 domain-containing protein [Erwinia persicina]|uniref:Fumarase D n=1 Tax=Erwinia persicina TaxID=55211 RepID=A0A356YLV6_9GAMM|nr:DUF2767 family protein [Erwinia persicina]AXU95128.1 DUF2767 domain-containing protein [Erwinia persicina]MBC3944014.1 DUF2767 family protein [Erwinia persicina]MBD8105046.1 DUF2767 family protein [Erwinia persicina]MBD8169374.1 DUF2767 family protein [Erwinia persicina]MBD8208192.1 DUF2767 family protein [Erwinia persicina]
MKRDVLSEEYYDEVCRVIGDAVIVLAEDGRNTQRSTITDLLQQTRQLRSDADREEQKVLEHAIRLIKPTP